MVDKKIFIVDEITQMMLLENEEIKKLVDKINNTDNEEEQVRYTDEIEDIIKKEFKCDEVHYAM